MDRRVLAEFDRLIIYGGWIPHLDSVRRIRHQLFLTVTSPLRRARFPNIDRRITATHCETAFFVFCEIFNHPAVNSRHALVALEGILDSRETNSNPRRIFSRYGIV